MTRIFITGDIHKNVDIHKLSNTNFPEGKNLTRNDYLIVTGDFGLPWTFGESKSDKYWLNWLNNKPYTILFVDGNHENFEALATYPITEINGAKCHEIRDNIFHILRGEIITLNDTEYLCMGGAISIDKLYRKLGLSYWEEEEPSSKEWMKFFENAKGIKNIISHDIPYSVILKYIDPLKGGNSTHPIVKPDNVNKIFEKFYQNNPQVENWYFGHHHMDIKIKDKNTNFYGYYQKIEEIKEQ